MAITKISTITVGSGGAASIDFTSIPGTYTDLFLVCSLRASSATEDTGMLRFNGDSGANYVRRGLYGTGSSAASFAQTTTFIAAGGYAASDFTANTFSNQSIYIPNYSGSTYKSTSTDAVSENNATRAYQYIWAGIWNNTAAITSMSLSASSGNLAENSTATLYGVLKGSSGGVTVS